MGPLYLDPTVISFNSFYDVKDFQKMLKTLKKANVVFRTSLIFEVGHFQLLHLNVKFELVVGRVEHTNL